MIVYRALVGARDHHKSAVFQTHVVQGHPDGQKVVVRMRIKRPVLVPLDRTTKRGRLYVELLAVVSNGGANQLGHDVQDPLVAQGMVVNRML